MRVRGLANQTSMKNLFSISSPDFALNERIEQEIRRKAADLDRDYDRVTGCDVTVAGPRRQTSAAEAYDVQIRVSMPGDELVINSHRSPELREAIREAFDVTGRCLRDYARIMRNARLSRC